MADDIVERLRAGSISREASEAMTEAANEITRLRAALSQPAEPGWQLVPVEPTPAMRYALESGMPAEVRWAKALAAAPQAPAQALTKAATDVLAERQRQISAEGWTPEHDDAHRTGGMAVAAACYAAWSMPSRPASEVVATMWPWTGWARQWFKPKDTRHNLIRAGALILAEIERLDRAHGITAKEPGHE